MKSICLVYPVENEMNATSKKETDAGIEGPMARRGRIELRPIQGASPVIQGASPVRRMQ